MPRKTSMFESMFSMTRTGNIVCSQQVIFHYQFEQTEAEVSWGWYLKLHFNFKKGNETVTNHCQGRNK